MKKYLALLLLFCTQLYAHEEHTKQLKIPLAISLAFDQAGSLWRVSVQDDFIVVDKSIDLGAHFSSAVKVNTSPQTIGVGGEARPKIVVSAEGYLYVTWTQTLSKPLTGYVWFARSINGGKSFEKPFIVHQDRAEITHRFDALTVAQTGEQKGNITVSWIDKRDLMQAQLDKKAYVGAAIYYAVSTNNGASFLAEQKLADASCECCRIAMTNNPDGKAVAIWRHVFDGGERDHAMAEIPQSLPSTKVASIPEIKRASYGHWKIDGCPHHGAAIAAGGEGKDWWGYHLAYFDGNDKKPGLYYSRMDGVAWASSVPKKFGNHQHQAGHPALISQGENVWLVWREIEDKTHRIYGQNSNDGGKSWFAPKPLMTTIDKSDYPQLYSQGNRVYLFWNTSKDGLKSLRLEVS